MRVLWGQYLGRPDCPYLRRWVLDLGLFSLRVHHWLASDDQRYAHDHPWWFVTLCLAGGYWDLGERGTYRARRGSVRYFGSSHRHMVKVDPGGCWTLLLTGPERRVWGFWVNGRFWRRNKYFFKYGHHPCE